MSARKIEWIRVAGNARWLRAQMSRYPYPTSFIQAMTPERNARHDELREYLDWCAATDLAAEYLGNGIISFDNEEDMVMFLLRWC